MLLQTARWQGKEGSIKKELLSKKVKKENREVTNKRYFVNITISNIAIRPHLRYVLCYYGLTRAYDTAGKYLYIFHYLTNTFIDVDEIFEYVAEKARSVICIREPLLAHKVAGMY